MGWGMRLRRVGGPQQSGGGVLLEAVSSLEKYPAGCPGPLFKDA